ncbi:MAG: LPS translocon maturation chaperone LptM [Alphaproteobacteria bacterium]
MARRLLVLAALSVIALILGCGRKGPLEPPPDDEDDEAQP